MMTLRNKLLLGAVAMLVGSCKLHSLYERRFNERPVTEPSPWKEFVSVKGQPLPVPKQWLTDDEARKAHDLVLPQNLSQLMVPFDFEAARWKSWLPWGSSVGDQYLEHLCTYEAGEWVFRVTEPQEGIYLARVPEHMPDDILWTVWDYEAPLLQKSWNSPPDEPPPRKPGPGWDLHAGANQWAGWAGDDERSHYRFVEFANTGKSWQRPADAPYFKVWGYHHTQGPGYPQVLRHRPMQMVGLRQPSARFGIAWRGLRRVQDREHRISGYELLVHDLQTGEVVAVRRQFARMRPHSGRPTFGAPDVCYRIHGSPNYQESTHRIAAIAIRSVTGAGASLFVDAYPKDFNAGKK